MNKQRKVVITITYNEMGIIIDTKAEEVVQPDHVADISKKVEGDCISRKAALKICHRYWHPTYNPIMEEIEKLPPAQPEPHWIPVSERLPEPRVDVWVNSDIGQIQGYYEEHIGIWYASFGQGRDYLELIVTAWMPLPEPYRAERRTDD